MRVLVLGGSVFVGRAVAETAVAAGHEVTVFNRGVTGADPAGVRAIRGDRERRADLRRAADAGPWDVVVDTAGYVPAVVALSARGLSGAAASYVFVSSTSVLPDWPARPVDADSPAYDCGPDEFETDYGPAKAGCERAVARYFAGPSLVLRCGILLGPHENIGRLPAWLERMARGGRVLAPGRPDDPMQLIDVRDVADFALRCVASRRWGTYLVAGPAPTTTVGAWLETCRAVTASTATLTWVDHDWLLARGVQPWNELPLWAPPPEFAAAWAVDTTPALRAGLTFRPMSETVADTWAWLRRTPSAAPPFWLQALDPAVEAHLLTTWDTVTSPARSPDERPNSALPPHLPISS